MGVGQSPGQIIILIILIVIPIILSRDNLGR